MPALYIDTQGAYLRKSGGEYLVEHNDEKKHFPLSQVERVILMGNVQVSAQAMASLLYQKTPVFFLSSRGQYRGCLRTAEHANVTLRTHQYDCLRASNLRLKLARWFVIGKIRNQKEFLCRRLLDAGHDTQKIRKQLKTLMENSGHASNLNELMGIEGLAAKTYFASFNQLLSGTEFQWNGRNRRPPLDPVNAMLSLGYTLIMNEVISSIEITGMDVFAGMLHGGTKQSEYGQPALALDLMEEFRYIVDRFVFRMITSRAINIDQFVYKENGACSMDSDARYIFFSKWEALLKSRISYHQKKLTYRQIIAEQASLLARSFLSHDVEYKPFMP